MAKRKNIHLGRRGVAMGTAVAAVLLAVNIGVGYKLLSGGKPAAETSMVATSDLAEQSEPVSVTPEYVSLMQQYYANQTGTPCDFDFTGWGKDINQTFENEEYRVTLKAVTGCDWVLYCFYDIEPLNSSQTEVPNSSDWVLYPCIADNRAADCNSINNPPIADPSGSGIWHQCVIFSSSNDTPFSAEGIALRFMETASMKKTAPDFSLPLDFLQKVPLEYTENCAPQAAEDDLWDSENPSRLNRTAVTPFGQFFFSEPYDNPREGSKWTCYSMREPDREISGADEGISVWNAEGKEVDHLWYSQDSCYGTTNHSGREISFIHILFDHPYDASIGSLTAPETADAPVVVISNNPSTVISDGTAAIELCYLIDAGKADTEKIITVFADIAGTPVKFHARTGGIIGDDTPTESFTFGLAAHAQPCDLTLYLQPMQAMSAYDLRIHFNINEADSTDTLAQKIHKTQRVQIHSDTDEPRALQFSFGGVMNDLNPGGETLTAAEQTAFETARKYAETAKFVYDSDEITGDGSVTLVKTDDTLPLSFMLSVQDGLPECDVRITTELDIDENCSAEATVSGDGTDFPYIVREDARIFPLPIDLTDAADFGADGKKLTVTVSYKPLVEGNDRWFNAVYVFIVNDAE